MLNTKEIGTVYENRNMGEEGKVHKNGFILKLTTFKHAVMECSIFWGETCKRPSSTVGRALAMKAGGPVFESWFGCTFFSHGYICCNV